MKAYGCWEIIAYSWNIIARSSRSYRSSSKSTCSVWCATLLSCRYLSHCRSTNPCSIFHLLWICRQVRWILWCHVAQGGRAQGVSGTAAATAAATAVERGAPLGRGQSGQ